MKKRQVIIALSLLFFVGAIIGSKKIMSSKKSGPRMAPPAEVRSVEGIEITNQNTVVGIAITGKLQAKNKIELYAEVSGNLLPQNDRFKEGNYFQSGSVLLALDDTELKLQVVSAKSNLLRTLTSILPDIMLDYQENIDPWKAYIEAFDVYKPLPSLPKPTQDAEKYFITGQGIYNQYYSIKSQEARLAKYKITAPYNGVVSQALIRPGTLVRAGQKLGEFLNNKVYELEVGVSLSYMPFISVGAEVELYSAPLNQTFKGVVERISDKIDEATQSAKVIIKVENPDLKEGMYLSGSILTKPFENSFSLNKNWLVNKNQLFIIENEVLVLKKVDVLLQADNEAVVSGLKNGTVLLKGVFSGVREGMKVKSSVTKAQASKENSNSK